VHEVVDRLVVLDRGRVVREFAKGEISLTELTNEMVALHEGHARAGV
jgi:ABC-type sugar transport system ATPase subunit